MSRLHTAVSFGPPAAPPAAVPPLNAAATRPEFHVERVSYEAMTPSAARGVLEAVHWKPAIRWVVTAIHVLAPVRFIAFKRNEVSRRVSTDLARFAMRGGSHPPYFADDDRQQRNTLALRGVDYVVKAHFVATPRWGPADTIPKHVETFARRLASGQTFHQPYLGCREFAARVEPADAIPESRLGPSRRDRDLGPMLYDIEFGAENPHLEFKRLPSYSPQLNPIERFWKKLRRRATHNRLFDTLADLKASIRTSLGDFQTVRHEVKSSIAGRPQRKTAK